MKSPLMAPNLLCSSLSLDRAGINLSQETLPKRGRGREAWIVAPGQSQSFFISCVHSDTRSSQHLLSAYYRPGWVWGEKKCLWHNLYSQKDLAGGRNRCESAPEKQVGAVGRTELFVHLEDGIDDGSAVKHCENETEWDAWVEGPLCLGLRLHQREWKWPHLCQRNFMVSQAQG